MAQLQVRFFTQQEKFKVEDIPFSVLGSVTTVELNELINKLINSKAWAKQPVESLAYDDVEEETKSSIEFEFLLDGEFLRSSILDHIEAKGLSVESVLLIEYIEKQEAPELESCLEHDDWVSGIHVSEKYILTGTYDSAVNIWSRKTGEKISSTIEHSEPVKAVRWLHCDNDKTFHFLSAAQDQNVIIWEFDTITCRVKPLFRCKGHSKSVDSLAVNSDETMFVSGSWDTTIKLWSSSLDLEEGPEMQLIQDLSNRKRQKIERKGFPRSPRLTLGGHTELVSGLLWLSEEEVCSASWDHTVRTWDVVEGREKSLQRGPKAVTSLAYSPLNKTIATGNTDRHIRLWDPRSGEGAVVKSNLTSHRNWITSVCWSPTLAHVLVSGSLDNIIKLWDIRSPKTPLFDMTAHDDAVMCVDWSTPLVIGSGGADNKSFIFSAADGNVDKQLT